MVHPFLSRILRGKQVEHKEGYFYLLGVPSFIFSLDTLVVMQKMLEQEYGQKGLSIMFQFLGYQTRMAAKMMKNRFGFPTEKAMRMQQGHVDMVGAGKIDFVRMDFKNNHFILKGESTFGREYLRTFGIQKEPVDWMFKGGVTNLISEYTGRKDIVCIETSCVAQGKPYCEFVAKPKKDFDLKNPKIKKQLPLEFKWDIDKIIKKHALGMPKRG